ncbi:LamG domain-containing protein [Sorangium sp. So ce367]|uniref:LamG domain-containing protein n=1 Tax=Sorangium sp. So ce367 TaxID=3133305 RepID=UPI003F637A3F
MTVPTPAHYWKFDEDSGTTARDSVGGATISLDRASWVVGRSGSAVRFDPDDGVRLATTDLGEIGPSWTAAFWVYRWSASGSASLFSSLDHALKLQQWKTPEEVGITTFGVEDRSFGVVVPLSEWTHLTLVGTATETRLYLNGVRKGSLPVSIPLGLYWLGSTQGYEEFAKALFDEVKVWDQALTDDQVGEVANGGPPSPPPPPPPITTIFPLAGTYNYVWGYQGQSFTVVISPKGENTFRVDLTSYSPAFIWSAVVVSQSQLRLTTNFGTSVLATLVAPNTINVESGNQLPAMVWTKIG